MHAQVGNLPGPARMSFKSRMSGLIFKQHLIYGIVVFPAHIKLAINAYLTLAVFQLNNVKWHFAMTVL
jgi:hypothetical protein